VGIVNAEDPSAKLFASDITNPILYGQKSGELRAIKVHLTPAGSRYVATIEGEEYRINCHLPGSFNVYNSLAAVGVGHTLGMTKKQIESGIDSLKAVEGRMTRVDEGQDFEVIVDYAHTPDSFRKIFEEIKPVTKGKLIVVFGSAGRRDEAKRARQGAVAAEYCDIVIVTEEDDRDCDGNEILEQIASGAEQQGKVKGKGLFVIHEREVAVTKAIEMAQANDVVLLLGKGHEESILTNGPKAAELRHLPQSDDDLQRVTKRPYNEIAVAKESLRNIIDDNTSKV
jgi:UDP-N-acetylmuramoyl-L-alanyl-D-glutamate--2,6-diaminopimelate ligase